MLSEELVGGTNSFVIININMARELRLNVGREVKIKSLTLKPNSKGRNGLLAVNVVKHMYVFVYSIVYRNTHVPLHMFIYTFINERHMYVHCKCVRHLHIIRSWRESC